MIDNNILFHKAQIGDMVIPSKPLIITNIYPCNGDYRKFETNGTIFNMKEPKVFFGEDFVIKRHTQADEIKAEIERLKEILTGLWILRND